MTSFERVLATNTSAQKQQRGILVSRWASAGIRTKILAPLILLMSLSLVGSTIGFTISTNTTRNRILDGQLNEEGNRIAAALQQSHRDVLNGAKALSQDPKLIQAIQDETTGKDDAIMLMVSRAVRVRERFRIDQVLVFNKQNQERVNISTYSDISEISKQIHNHAAMKACDTKQQVRIVDVQHYKLIVSCSPIWESTNTIKQERIGIVYTAQDIPRSLDRIRRELGLTARIELPDQQPSPQNPLDEQPPQSINGNRVEQLPVDLELTHNQIAILLKHSEQEINAIVGSGFRVMLISSGLTLVLLLILGYWLSLSFTKPILKLAHVAQQVADGDLSVRSNLTHQDEIGQLGRAFDQATTTITDLLHQRARTAGELHAILQSLADGVLAVDKDEQIVMVNPTAATLLGQQPNDLLAQPLNKLKDVEDPVLSSGLEQVIDQLRSEIVDPDHAETEERVTLGERIVRLNSTPTLGTGGTVTGAVVVLQDITEAVESDRAKSAFIGTASHEMRTPLASLKGFVDIFFLSGTDNLTESQHTFLETIKRQTNNMVQLVNDLLEMARLEQRTISGEQRWVSVENTIQEAVANLSVQVQNRQADITVSIEPQLPQIWIDTMHFRRILTNIISNAIKYIHQGGSIQIRAYELDDPDRLPSSPGDQPWKHGEQRSVVIEVEDNGVGIRESDQHKIFTRFFRSENTLSVEAGGSGLGLAITQSLVHLHGGQIGFRSVENEGTCFWVRFPAPSTEHLSEETTPSIEAETHLVG